MVSLKQLTQRQSGFTIVELLIVIVIIGILAGLVITTFVGIQARGRDAERQTDVKAIQGQLEAYFASNGGYPALADLNSSTWRANNKFTIDTKALSDPKGSTTLPAATVSATQYGYATTPASCNSPTTNASPPAPGVTPYCITFTLTAQSEVDPTKTFTAASQ